MSEHILLTPGPTPLPPSVRAKMAEPILHHRTQEFAQVFQRVLAGMQQVFRTKSQTLMLTTSGTGAMESAVANLLSPGDRALVHSTGAFGNRFVKILKAYGIEPMVIFEEWGEAAQPQRLKALLNASPGFKVVFFQHTDTSTGVLNDIETLSRTVRENSDALVVVDTVSGLAAERFETDSWGVDVALTGSQKGLMNAPGLAFAAVSEKAWTACGTAKLPRFYLDWRTMRDSLPQKETPYTPAVSLVVAQAEALRLILKEGLDNVVNRTRELALYTRTEVTNRLGLRLFAKDPAHILTAAWLPEGADGDALLKNLLTEERISIANGQEKLKGKIIRIAHMGYISKSDVQAGLSALERRLKTLIGAVRSRS
ncbi:MAG: alanine--glyoxylate aminotransferase family protein [Elusimicrobia bacterium]|nr:alanine--glyoxylate aminotransferase family protein [Elusimicrobiota bacterium]